MQLTDFFEFEPFLQLRKKMQAERLGSFELFDGEHHLTSKERDLLECSGLIVPREALRVLRDSTLAYKNSRVFLLGDLKGEAGLVFHLAGCPTFEVGASASGGREVFLFTCLSVFESKNRAGSSLDGRVVGSPAICLHCLEKVPILSAEKQRGRRRYHRDNTGKPFCTETYFKKYCKYPLPVSEFNDDFLF